MAAEPLMPLYSHSLMETFDKENILIPNAMLRVGIRRLLYENRWAEAYELMIPLMNNYDAENHPYSISLLKCAVFIKLKLEDYLGADKYLTQILKLRSCKERDVVLLDAIAVKMVLEQWAAADVLCHQYLKKHFHVTPPLRFLNSAVLINKHYNREEEAQWFSHLISVVNLNLKNVEGCKEIDALTSTEMFTKNELPFWLLDKIAYLKTCTLKKHEEAKVICDKMEVALDKLSGTNRRSKEAHLLLQRGIIHYHLSQFEQAYDFFKSYTELNFKRIDHVPFHKSNRQKSNNTRDVSAAYNILSLAQQLHFWILLTYKLNKWKELEELAETHKYSSLGPELKQKLVVLKMHAKLALGKFDEAKIIYSSLLCLSKLEGNPEGNIIKPLLTNYHEVFKEKN
jgi:hypothetical protein